MLGLDTLDVAIGLVFVYLMISFVCSAGVELEAKEHISKALKSALLTAEGSIDKAVKNIEDWYNSSMDRVSGWFKRRTQYILLCFGVACAVVYNVDTIAIVRRLATDKAVRSALVASAGAAVNEKQTTTTVTDTTSTTAARD